MRALDGHNLLGRAGSDHPPALLTPFRAQVDDWRDQALERVEFAELCLEHARRGVLPE